MAFQSGWLSTCSSCVGGDEDDVITLRRDGRLPSLSLSGHSLLVRAILLRRCVFSFVVDLQGAGLAVTVLLPGVGSRGLGGEGEEAGEGAQGGGRHAVQTCLVFTLCFLHWCVA